MPAGGLVIAGAGLAYSAIDGAIKEHKANEMKPKDPTYVIPQEFYQNREIARQMARQGLPQQVINNQTNSINQNQAAGIAAAQNSNNPGGSITSIVRQGNSAIGKLDAEDAQARDSNQRYFINQNSQVAQQELAKQQNDVYDKFTRDFNESQAYRGAGQQEINNAIGGAQQLGETYLKYQNPTTPTAAGTPSTDNLIPTPTTPGVDPVTGMPIPAALRGNPINTYNYGVQWGAPQ